jgi:hypothetical protein
MTCNDRVMRSKTPVDEVEAIRAEWADIDEDIARGYSVRDLGDGDFSFSWPVIVLRGAGV